MKRLLLLLTTTALATSSVAVAKDARVLRSFSAEEVKRVVLRAEAYHGLQIIRSESPSVIQVSALPQGGAKGYHSGDPSWKETSATDWGLDFEAKIYGDTLVISTKNELRYIHHNYAFTEIKLAVPSSVDVTLIRRQLNGDGSPDLSPP